MDSFICDCHVRLYRHVGWDAYWCIHFPSRITPLSWSKRPNKKYVRCGKPRSKIHLHFGGWGIIGKWLYCLNKCNIMITTRRPQDNRRWKNYILTLVSLKVHAWPLSYLIRKYYLVDSGYTTMNEFIAPYHSVKYHLKIA